MRRCDPNSTLDTGGDCYSALNVERFDAVLFGQRSPRKHHLLLKTLRDEVSVDRACRNAFNARFSTP